MKPDYERGGVRLWNCDCLEWLATLEAGEIQALITDPPYSSGGAYRGDRTNKALTKYVRSISQSNYTDFTGDNRDQRSFLAWCSLWLSAAHAAAAPGSVLCVFSDWRQVPIMTDAVQCAGWTWRNLATWWKPGCRMQKGRFSSSAEFVVYGTRGSHASDGEESPQNVFSFASLQTDDKNHIAEKPLEVLWWLLGLTRTGAVVADPFLGSGTTGVACVRLGRRFLGCEIDPRYFDLACKRIDAAIDAGALFDPTPPAVRQGGLFEAQANTEAAQ